jgi:hypothetical protein
LKRRLFLVSSAAAVFASASAHGGPEAANRYRWSQLSSFSEGSGLSARDFAAAFQFHGRVWILDGYLPGGDHTGDLLVSEDGVHWDTVISQVPFPKFAPVGVFGGSLWVASKGVWRSGDGVNFEEVASANLPPHNPHSPIMSFGGEMVIINPHSAECFVSVDGDSWAKTNLPFAPRWGGALCCFGGRAFLFGGGIGVPNSPPEEGYPDRTSTSEVWSSDDPATPSSWVQHAPAPWAPRMWPAVCEHDGLLYFSGGYNSLRATPELNFSDLWTMIPDGAWGKVELIDPPLGKHAATLFSYKGKLMMACGNTNLGNSVSSEIYELIVA